MKRTTIETKAEATRLSMAELRAFVEATALVPDDADVKVRSTVGGHLRCIYVIAEDS